MGMNLGQLLTLFVNQPARDLLHCRQHRGECRDCSDQRWGRRWTASTGTQASGDNTCFSRQWIQAVLLGASML